MKTVKVLLASYGRVQRGIETVVKELFIKRLSKNFKIEIYCSSKLKDEGNVKFKYIPSFPREHFFSEVYSGIAEKLKIPFSEPYQFEVISFCFSLLAGGFFFSPKKDIIFNLAGIPGALLCSLKRKISGNKFILSGQAGIGPIEAIDAKFKPDIYAALTQYAAKWIKTKQPLLNVKIIPNGINTDIFKPFEVKNKTNLKKPICLYVGALDEMKRPLLTIEAVKKTSLSLIMIGGGPLKEKVLKEAAALKNGFLHIPELKHNELAHYYNLCDVFTLPSFDEPFGIVMLEALACGKPVVTQDDPIRRELLNGFGIFADCTDKNDYSQKLNKALNFFTEEKHRALKSYIKKFDWDIIAAQYKEEIEKI